MANETHAGIHYVNADETTKVVTVNRKNGDDRTEFDFPICEMSPNLSFTAKVDLGSKIAEALNEDLWTRMGEKF